MSAGKLFQMTGAAYENEHVTIIIIIYIW